MDLVTTLPLESIILGGMGIGPHDDDDRVLFVGLIHWIKLVGAHGCVLFVGFIQWIKLLGAHVNTRLGIVPCASLFQSGLAFVTGFCSPPHTALNWMLGTWLRQLVVGAGCPQTCFIFKFE